MKEKLDTRSLFRIFLILNSDLTWAYCQMKQERMKTSACSHPRKLNTTFKRMASSTNAMLKWSAKSLLASTVSNLIRIRQKQLIADNPVWRAKVAPSMIKTVTSNLILLQTISVKMLMLPSPKMMNTCTSRDRVSQHLTRKSSSESMALKEQILSRKALDHRLF